MGKAFRRLDFAHLSELERHLRGRALPGDIILLLVQEVLHALLVDLDLHLGRFGVVVGTAGNRSA